MESIQLLASRARRSLMQDREKVLQEMIGELGKVHVSEITRNVQLLPGGKTQEVWYHNNKPFVKFGPIEMETKLVRDSYQVTYKQDSYKYA